MFLRVEDGKDNDLKESTEGTREREVHFVVAGATVCNMLRESSIDIQIYVARMTRRLQIFVLAHSWNIWTTQSALVHHKTTRLFLSRRGLRKIYHQIIPYMCVCMYFSRFLRTILFSAIFSLCRGSIAEHFSVSSFRRTILYNVQLSRESMQKH